MRVLRGRAGRPGRHAPVTTLMPMPGKALRWGILAGIALVLLTPFVVTTGTIYPFAVGKAVWSRSIIEIVFALWAILALADPACRPPRSRVLLLLAAGLAVSLLAACFGVSLQRSLWSDYERMQGIVDLAHWFAFTVVLVSMLRTGSAWRVLLAFSVAASAAMACMVIALSMQIEIPFYGTLPERNRQRMGGPMGNPVFLSVYMLGHLLIALGFVVRSCLPAVRPEEGAVAAPAPPRRAREGRRGVRQPQAPRRPARQWTAGLLWALAAALDLWGLALAGSVGGFAGLLAGAGFLAFTFARLTRGRGRWVAAATLAVLGALVIVMGVRFVDADRSAAAWLSSPMVRYVASVHLQRPSVQSRLAAWDAGLEGFAERPLLGWGPGNFGTVFGRFASGYGASARSHDQAHGKLIEVTATTGILGVLAYLALWSWSFLVVWRIALGAGPRDRVMVLFIGAALASLVVQRQFLFDTAVGSLQTAILLGFVARLEAPGDSRAPRHRLPARLRETWSALLGRGTVRMGLGAAALAVTAAGLIVNHAILSAADLQHYRKNDDSLSGLARGIEGFRPLAYSYRLVLFDTVADNWTPEPPWTGEEARRLLAWVEREEEDALRAEPERWRIHHSLARMYRAVASTDPEYREKAQQALARARALTPNRAVFPVPLGDAKALTVRRLDDGTHELRWQPAEGAGYHVVSQAREDGSSQFLLHTYDPARTSFVRPGRQGPGTYRYRVKACRHPGHCTASDEWSPMVEPASPPDP